MAGARALPIPPPHLFVMKPIASPARLPIKARPRPSAAATWFRPPLAAAVMALAIVALAAGPAVAALDELPQPDLILPLWPELEVPPGDEGRESPPEQASPPREGDPLPVLRLSHVSQPELWVYRPDNPAPGRPAVLICPGGGYHILAFEHEGTMVAEWLNEHGITALLLKYRVPRRSEEQPHEVPLKDARRAMGLARHHADDWGIDPGRIGALGFSAGSDLALRLSLATGERDYPAHEQFDAADTRPDFLVTIYPAYRLVDQTTARLRGDLDFSGDLPPAFFVHGHEDNHSAAASALLYLQWLENEVPAELHIYARGGHGFGMRAGDLPVNAWPQRCLEWIDSMRWRATD